MALALVAVVLLAGAAALALGLVPLGRPRASAGDDSPSAPREVAADPSQGKANDGSSSSSEAASGEKGATSATPAPSEDDTPLQTGADAKVVTQAGASGVSATAPEGFVDTPTFQRLEQAVADFQARGYHLGFALEDLPTGRSLSYDADRTFYPASSVKAVYCAAVLETVGDPAAKASADTIRSCLVDSDNDAFRSLLKTYGYRLYGDWLKGRAPEAAQEAYSYNYPHISAKGMLACWKEIYSFGTSGGAGADLLGSCLSQTHHSAWGGLLRGRWTVWSKPGWYPANEGLASTATADDAIVFSDCGDYAVAVLSDAPSDFDALLPVVDALNAAHGKMCGGSSATTLTSSTTLS